MNTEKYLLEGEETNEDTEVVEETAEGAVEGEEEVSADSDSGSDDSEKEKEKEGEGEEN